MFFPHIIRYSKQIALPVILNINLYTSCLKNLNLRTAQEMNAISYEVDRIKDTYKLIGIKY